LASDDWNACTLEAGADRTYAVLDGGEDFGGADLSGIDLTLSRLDDVNFDGASLQDATLIGAQGGFGATFIGADFSGADLTSAALRNVGQANLTNAKLAGARIGFTDVLTLEGADLDNAWLRQDEPVLAAGFTPLELSLTGLDLSGAWISGPSEGGEPHLAIADLRGANLERARLYGREDGHLRALLRSVVAYRLAFGQPRQDDIVAWLGDRLTDADDSSLLNDLRVALSPPD